MNNVMNKQFSRHSCAPTTCKDAAGAGPRARMHMMHQSCRHLTLANGIHNRYAEGQSRCTPPYMMSLWASLLCYACCYACISMTVLTLKHVLVSIAWIQEMLNMQTQVCRLFGLPMQRLASCHTALVCWCSCCS